jgi:hypothetical protein
MFEVKSRLFGAKPHEGEEDIAIMMQWWITLRKFPEGSHFSQNKGCPKIRGFEGA